MKKNHLLILTSLFCFFLLTSNHAYSQKTNNMFSQGQYDLNVGIGIGATFSSLGRTTLPPLSVSLDYGYNDNISIGGYLGVAGTAIESFGFGDEYRVNSFLFGVRGAYHYPLVDKLDTYGGLLLGYHATKVDSDIGFGDIGFGGFLWAGYIGARYPITPKAGVFAELGYGISYLTIGYNQVF